MLKYLFFSPSVCWRRHKDKELTNKNIGLGKALWSAWVTTWRCWLGLKFCEAMVAASTRLSYPLLLFLSPAHTYIESRKKKKKNEKYYKLLMNWWTITCCLLKAFWHVVCGHVIKKGIFVDISFCWLCWNVICRPCQHCNHTRVFRFPMRGSY